MVRGSDEVVKTGHVVPERTTQPTTSGTINRKGRRGLHANDGFPFLRNSLERLGLDKITLDRIIKHAWRPGMVKLYSTYLKKLGLHCALKGVPPLKPTIPQVARFLRMLDDEGLGYGAVNTARCALSVILPRENGISVGKTYEVHLVMRTVYACSPPKAKYERFWDVSLVFDYIRRCPSNSSLSLKDLGFKLVLLLLLTSGHRGQTIVALSLKNVHVTKDEVVFELDKILKSNRLGDRLTTVVFQNFPQEKKLCVVHTIHAYIERTEALRKSDQLLISFIKPHGPISRDTLARWTLWFLKAAGVNTADYSSHSTRGAMASKARLLGVSVRNILIHAGWKTQRSFAKHYNRRVEKTSKVAETILKD